MVRPSHRRTFVAPPWRWLLPMAAAAVLVAGVADASVVGQDRAASFGTAARGSTRLLADVGRPAVLRSLPAVPGGRGGGRAGGLVLVALSVAAVAPAIRRSSLFDRLAVVMVAGPGTVRRRGPPLVPLP